MKTENNRENKKKFFALYFGQKVAKGIFLAEVDSDIIHRQHRYHLLLKPLSAITDEDAIACNSLHNALIGYDDTMDFATPIEMAKHWLSNGGEKDMVNTRATVDYLRSHGYALPFQDLSVDDLVVYGWIKLKES